MNSNQVNKILNMTKVIVIDKTKDISAEFTKAFANNQNLIQNYIVYISTVIVIFYFIIMDMLTYMHIQNKPVRTADPLPAGQGFNYFEMLSVKGMMEDHLSCHINWPTAELFESKTNISQFPGITATKVSVFGMFVAIPAAKLMLMESLLAKRLGIVLFMFRLWIDSLDGIVYRMQNLSAAEQHVQQSARHTTGWLIDFFCDLFAALMFLLVVYHILKQSVAKYSTYHMLPLLPVSNNCQNNHSPKHASRPSSPNSESPERECSLKAIYIKLLWVALVTMSASALWDYFVQQYRDVLETTLPSSNQQIKQNLLLKGNFTFLIFWCWRLLNGVAVVNTAYLATAYDKLWEYAYYLQVVGTPALILLSVMTMVHLCTIHNALGL